MNRYIPSGDDNKLIKFPYEVKKEFINKYLIMKKGETQNNLSMYL